MLFFFALSYHMSLRTKFLVISVAVSAWKRCSVRICLLLFVGGLVYCLFCLCLFTCSSVRCMLCFVCVCLRVVVSVACCVLFLCLFFFVLCTLCCQILWIVQFLLYFRKKACHIKTVRRW